ncbi:MAG: 1-acyl-sn-glycerol-3-phosphate acyltransferase [Bacteroidales bacterium]|nr:1-acyl-sn-glycerol-3-phosphate acyltransferase [Bacteroidales bacterium]
MFKEEDFEQIRPYFDHEVHAAVNRILTSPIFEKILSYISPYQDTRQFRPLLEKTSTIRDFQKNLMHPLVRNIIEHSSEEFTVSGLQHMLPDTPYLFLANHRDIVLDSALLQLVLFDNGFETTEITFGSNLMTSQFIIDFGRLNKMFVVNRGANGRELFKNAQLLSAYIRHTITKKKASVWIAQRNGRTKDGNDRTEPGLLKMLNISGARNFKQSFKDLNIIPLTISYEFEPCCALKIKETIVRLNGVPYHKKPGEDLTSIITGVTQQKGRIHLSFGRPLNSLLEETDRVRTVNEKISVLTSLVDSEISRQYKLWPSNYIAYGMLHDTDEFAGFYSRNDREKFLEYMHQELKEIDIDEPLKRELFLKIYSNPVDNIKKVGIPDTKSGLQDNRVKNPEKKSD